MRNLRFWVAPLVLALGVSALPACSKLKQSLNKGDGGAASAQAASGELPSFDQFEGEIDLAIKPGPKEHPSKPPPPINLLVKSGKLRFDLPSDMEELKGIGPVYLVLAAKDKKLFIVLDAGKEVVQIDLDKLGEEMKSFGPRGHEPTPSAAKSPPKIVKTGHKDTVAGYSCEDWDIVPTDGSRSKASVCVAERSASWFSLPTLGLPDEYKFIAEMLDGRHFPLRFIGYEKDGTEGGRIEVTKLEQKPLQASQFEIPAGYRTVTVQEAIQHAMQAAMRPPGAPPGPAVPPGIAKPPAHPPAAAPPKHK